MGRAGLRRPTGSLGNIGATLALRQNKGMEEVHAYRIAARRLLALLALWRPLIHEPELERRLTRAVGTLSALRDAPGLCAASWWFASAEPLATGPLLTGLLPVGWPDWKRYPSVSISCRCFSCIWRCHCRMHWLKTTSLPVGIRARLRCWHRLRLVLETGALRDGAADGTGEDPAWLSMLVSWQERLGQLQDRRQWLRRLRGETGRGQQRRALKTEIRCQLLQLDCHQAELVGLRMALQQSGR